MKQRYITPTVQKVEAWADARGLLDEDGTAQFLKWGEEFGEYCGAAVRNKDKEKIKDGIGDTLVTVIIWSIQNNWKTEIYHSLASSEFSEINESWTEPPSAAAHISVAMGNMFLHRDKKEIERVVYYLNEVANFHGFTLVDCLNFAFSEIENRKGKKVNGSFIKDSDL